MIRAVPVLIALCAAGFVYLDYRHSRIGDPRRAGKLELRIAKLACVAALVWIAWLSMPTAAHARPLCPAVTQFKADRYDGGTPPACMHRGTAKKLNSRAAAARRWKGPVPKPRPRPAVSATLAGVVAPLAAKAREIVAGCGSTVISGVRHTYIAGTGGRLSLHASGRAVDIKGNPACIRAHLVGWPGGASTDYSAVNHTHISYAPGGPEWGSRFAHYRGKHRHRHRRTS